MFDIVQANQVGVPQHMRVQLANPSLLTDLSEFTLWEHKEIRLRIEHTMATIVILLLTFQLVHLRAVIAYPLYA